MMVTSTLRRKSFLSTLGSARAEATLVIGAALRGGVIARVATTDDDNHAEVGRLKQLIFADLMEAITQIGVFWVIVGEPSPRNAIK